MRSWSSGSERETREVGELLGREAAPDGILLVSGTLGAGKTVLVKGVATALGVDPAHVQSPTYTLMQRHHGALGELLHVDLYRLDPSQLPGIGLEEELAGPGVKVVEWPERLTAVPGGSIWIHIERGDGDDDRRITQRELPARPAGLAREGEQSG